MTPSLFLPVDLSFVQQMPRQHHFLTQLLPAAQKLTWVQAIWLSGSFARGDADRWSNLNLHLLSDGSVSDGQWIEAPETAVEVDVQMDRTPLDQVVSDLCTLFDQVFQKQWHCRLRTPTLVSGFTFILDSEDARRGGVHFDIRWTDLAHLNSHLHRYRPVRLLSARSSLPATLSDYLSAPWPALIAPDAQAVAAGLAYFWMTLSYLPPLINRQEHIAAAQKLSDARQCLADLVVALNGAQRPLSSARINQYLGPAQLDAFEKTLPIHSVDSTAWIGQAVALIVLYRWYAPQLVDVYAIDYPDALERSVLALLSSEVDGWPALIQTG